MSDNELEGFNRVGLIGIREKAEHSIAEAEDKELLPAWKRAYERLADAADHLDAMIARFEATEEKPRMPVKRSRFQPVEPSPNPGTEIYKA